MKRQLTIAKSQKGFTILELMIATTIVSVILILVTVVLISIGNLFYKGNSQATAQDSARSIIDEISQQLELSSGAISSNVSTVGGTVYAYCIGSYRYSFIPNQQIGTNLGQVMHVIWRDAAPSSGGCTALSYGTMNTSTPSSGGTELMPANTWLTCLDINGSCGSPLGSNGSPYTMTVGIAFGDPNLTNGPGNGTNTTCQGSDGDQFCATANLTTNILQRLN